MTVVLFGATGHLATTRLFPALLNSERFRDAAVIGVGRSDYTTDSFRQLLREKGITDEGFLERLQYAQASPEEGYGAVRNLAGNGDRLLYCSVPPEATEGILDAIAKAELNKTEDGSVKIVIEKPFGTDRTSSQTLLKRLAELFPEQNIYPLDHYIAKETVENLLAFRFGNALFEPLWSAEYIREIQITIAEAEGVEGRVTSYKGIGAVKDLLQNHALQLLALLLMDEPEVCKPQPLAKAKEALLQNLEASSLQTVLGQYQADPEIAEALGTTETYVATVFHLNTERWRTVPIVVRTGKKLATTVTDITLHFRPGASSLFGTKGHANYLTFRIQPDESIFLSLAVKEPGEQFVLRTARMTFCYHDAFKRNLRDAYQRALEEILVGDRSVAVSAGFIDQAWRIIESMHTQSLPVHRYQPEGWGPAEADRLLSGGEWTVTTGDVCNGVTMMP